MNNKPHDIDLAFPRFLKAEQDGIDVRLFKFRVRQMEQTLAWQRSLLAHYSASLSLLRKSLHTIESRLDSIAT